MFIVDGPGAGGVGVEVIFEEEDGEGRGRVVVDDDELARADGGGGREGLAVVESAGLDTDSSCLRFVWRCGVELGTLGVFSLARAGGGQPAGPFATGRRSTGKNAH